MMRVWDLDHDLYMFKILAVYTDFEAGQKYPVSPDLSI